KITENLDGVICHADDILVFGITKTEHDERLQKLLSVLKNSEVTLNEEKCQFGVEKLNFLGHTISSKGISADPEKTRAIFEFPVPNNVEKLRQFLGMSNYLLKFSAKLTEELKVLRELTSSKVEFIWSPIHQKAFQRIKSMLCSDVVLSHYNPQKKLRVAADESVSGRGEVLEQLEGSQWKPVMYDSRILTPPVTRYAQIEKEALALTWAC